MAEERPGKKKGLSFQKACAKIANEFDAVRHLEYEKAMNVSVEHYTF